MARDKIGRNDPCPCGSGKKYKQCCLKAQESPPPAPAPNRMQLSEKPWGVPGEEHQLWVVPLKAGEMPPENLRGSPGKYRVQILLSRPGYPVTAEREHKFIDEIVGDSHILIAKPLKERKPEDADRVLLKAAAHGREVVFTGFPNEQGYLGKLIVEEIDASSFHEAETEAYQALAPFLSAWSVHLDIPVHAETMQVTELQSSIHSLRVRTPPFEMTFAGGLSPLLSDDFCQYASLYREGMNCNSNYYRFLCFYKIIESLQIRRNRKNAIAAQSGRSINRQREVLPRDTAELVVLLETIYPWRAQWDSFALAQLLPVAAVGKKVGWVHEHCLTPLRVRIAHALLDTGEVGITLDKLENIQQVNTWLPLCRLVVRWMLRNEFPEEFGLKMRPVFL